MAAPTTPQDEPPSVAGTVRAIGEDLKIIAASEIELSRLHIGEFIRSLLLKVGVALFGAMIVLVGWAVLCLVAVPALEPVIQPLWLRFLAIAIVYMASGAIAVRIYGKRMLAVRPHLEHEMNELKKTAAAVEHGLTR